MSYILKDKEIEDEIGFDEDSKKGIISSSDDDSLSEIFQEKKGNTNVKQNKNNTIISERKKKRVKNYTEQPKHNEKVLKDENSIEAGERKSSRKRKAKIDDSDVKPPKIHCNSPGKLSTPILKLKRISVANKSIYEISSTRNKNENEYNVLPNDKDYAQQGSPKKLSAKKNLFSSENSCTSSNSSPIKVHCYEKNTESPAKLNNGTFKLSTTQQNNKVQLNQNTNLENRNKRQNEISLKSEEVNVYLTDEETEFSSIKHLNESSPFKNTSARDLPNSQTPSKNSMLSVSTSNGSPKTSSLITKTPQKDLQNTRTKNELKRLAIDANFLNEKSPLKTLESCFEVSSPQRKSRRRSPVKRVTSLDKWQNDEKKENKESKMESETNYSTPKKTELQKIIEENRTPLSSSKFNDSSDKSLKLSSPCQKKQITVTTPVSKKNSGRGFLTPSMAKKEHVSHGRRDDALDKTRKQLHISTIPKSLPCRGAEFNQIKMFLLRKIEHAAGGCMYISGVPGTGKTATVHAVIRSLQEGVDEGDVSDFDFVEVNGLRLTEPKQAYVRILQSLTDKKLTPDQAQQLLNKRFSGSCKKSTIILVDELDYLCNRRQDVVYNILDWPTKRSSALVVLTISNTMDLPERTLKGRVTSRMGLTRLVFQPYSHHQLREIVSDRLSGSDTFHPDAVQLVARKVAAVSGDARRALDICRRTTELVKSGEQVTATHVEQALTQIFSGPRILVIQSLGKLSQLVLRCLRDVNDRSGVDEATVRQVYYHLQQICSLEGYPLPSVGSVLQTCVGLVALGLMVAEKGRMDIARKLSLNVSSDDIHYALDKLKT